MPELPEVEALRRYLLTQRLVGRRITGVHLGWPKAVREPSPVHFRRALKGRSIEGIERRGKFLLLPLDGPTLIIHLRMTGYLELALPQEPPHRFAHNLFLLDDGRELRSVDRRKLGMMWLVQDTTSVLGRLGPEPLEDGFTAYVLAERLGRHQVPLKARLCEQEAIAGIGNIYADEALFCAGIPPTRVAMELAPQEIKRLHRCIRKVLSAAIERLVPTLPLGGPFSYAEEGSHVLKMPRQKGAPCTGCRTPIRRTVIRGRSAYFCPHCQR